ncbi:hypothetical protein DU002_08400 [Corallincola holothuriorum]|uniref:Lipoprotein n=1 Tax=Corallincola holothuriorum TaxID=2282215 RepID=A0A368NLD1_9GAMM|nr:hypothetical protein [Corallincola holothuriorum]RCU50434.1 hypothetical protein DU002_08400 [Corallincola holothuriorum]
MNKLFACAAISVALVALSGCVNTTGSAYVPSTNNVIRLQNLLGENGQEIRLDKFTESDAIGELVCRLGAPIEPTPGKTNAQYIFDALQTELFMANVYDAKSAVKVSGELSAIGFSSVSPATWNISLKMRSNMSEGYVVHTRYSFQTSYDGKEACQNVADAFSPAVQQLINDVISHPGFPALVGQNQGDQSAVLTKS